MSRSRHFRHRKHASKLHVERRRLEAARAWVAAFQPRTEEQNKAKRQLDAIVALLTSKIRAGHTVGCYWDFYSLFRDLAEHGEPRSRASLRVMATSLPTSDLGRVRIQRLPRPSPEFMTEQEGDSDV